MSYVKNYNVGQILLDLPTPNYFHELPLLSFGDVHGSVNLSLVFNYGLKAKNSNLYSIAAGYKLNLQKRIMMSNGIPSEIQAETGKTITLNKTNSLYCLDDDTQRVLRLNNGGYELENADYSKEIYDSTGKITAVYDKYETLLLSYSYDSSDKLVSITYRNAKTITLSYDSAGCLSAITYNGKTISLTCATSEVHVTHFNGVTFSLAFSNENFTATATATENSATVTYSTKIERPSAYWKILKVTNLIGNDVVNEMTYEFSDMIIDYPNTALKYASKYSQVDLTDKNGVKTRAQYQEGKLLYSYEINSSGEYADGDISLYRTIDDLDNNGASGTVTKYAGLAMHVTNSTTQVWEHDVCDHYDSGVMGYYIVTGWIRSKDDNVSSPLYISTGGGGYDIQFTPDVTPYKQWKYFAYKFYLNANVIKILPQNTGFVELKDLRIIFKPTHTIDKTYGDRLVAISENVLIHHNGGTYDYLPIHDAIFTCGSENICDYGDVHFEDVLRYKLNRKYNLHTNEIYYNKCKSILTFANELKVTYNGVACSLTNFYLGTRTYTKKGVITTLFKDDTTDFLVCEVQNANGSIISSRVINNRLDITSETVDGVTTSYVRQNDLITNESVQDDLGNTLYTRTTSYGVNPSGDPTITFVDEFHYTTVYTLDSVWGNVKSVTLPGGQVVTDVYDSDACAKVKRTFASGGRSHIYDYFGGDLSRVQGNGITYDFAYSKGNLSSVKKNGALIEEHEITDTQTDSYYPSESNAIYSSQATFDKYGRLTTIANILTNTYRTDASCASGNYTTSDNDNASSVLVSTTDHTTGNVTKYGYAENKPEKAAVFSSSGTKLGEESFTYDDANRLISNEYVYGSQSVKDTREYATVEDAINIDERVHKHTFAINGSTVVSSTNSYDAFKRLKKKTITVGSNRIEKNYSYNKTWPTVTSHYRNNIRTHYYSCNHDNRMRINAETDADAEYENYYIYDSYGQLTRENNGHYGKTILYIYDNVGNITKAQKYDYTTGSVSGAPTEDTYVYSTSSPDRLTSFNNKAITYDGNGCVKTYDGWTYTWNRGKLTSMNKSTSGNTAKAVLGGTSYRYTFTYNAKGQRTQKKYTYMPGLAHEIDYMSSCTTAYEYDLCGRLLSDIRTLKYKDGSIVTKKFVFMYEESDIVGVQFTNAGGTGTYYYDKNPRGDVIGILDNSGNTVVKYSYDAYGNCSRDYSTNNDLADSNPIRYRSYYYDNETGLYYLNARYYSPEWRRFISPDDTTYLDPDSVNGLNLYCYCNNDPVNYADPSGHFAFWIAAGLAIGTIGLISGGIYAGIKSSQAGNTGWDLFCDIALGAAIGGILGFAIGALMGAGISGFLTGYFLSSVKDVIAGAVLMHQMFRLGGIATVGYMILDNLSNAFKSPLHVFWSGGDIAKNQAMAYANQNGGITLEMTRLGKYLETQPCNRQLWEYASRNFANQVSNNGVVRAILYYPQMNENAIWFTEKEILIKKLVEIIIGSLQ